MRWGSTTNLSYFFTTFFSLSWILLVVSIYLQSIALFLITISLILLTVITRWYMKQASESIQLQNSRRTVKLFNGEQEKLSFALHNESKFPIWNGHLHFSLEPVVSIADMKQKHKTGGLISYSAPFFLPGRVSKIITFPIFAEKRGITRVRGIEIKIQDLLGIGRNEKKLESPFYTEILIFPEVLKVNGVEKLSTMEMGNYSYQHSLYENLSAPSGARDYMSSDPFNRIHWKATARTSELKTKMYERSIDMRWVFILDVSVKRLNSFSQISNEIETYISHLAFLCKIAAKNGIAFELHINLEPEGPSPCITLETGEGYSHLNKALELLARVDESRPLLSFARMDSWLTQRLSERAVIIRLGEPMRSIEEATFYQNLQRSGHVCYEVERMENGAFLKKLEGHKV